VGQTRHVQPAVARRQALLDRASALRARVSRLYAVVDAAEQRAAARYRQVQALRAHADALRAASARGLRRPQAAVAQRDQP
jgi:hypothetical protein